MKSICGGFICANFFVNSLVTPNIQEREFNIGSLPESEKGLDRKETFRKVFKDGLWIVKNENNELDGKSGFGSFVKNTRNIQKILDTVIRTLKVKELLLLLLYLIFNKFVNNI